MSSSRSMPVWLRSVLIIIGGGLVLAALWQLYLTIMALWHLGHTPPAGLMAQSGKLLAAILARLLAEIVVIMVGGWVLSKGLKKKQPSLTEQAAAMHAAKTTGPPPVPVAAIAPVKRVSRKRWQSANVLQAGQQVRKL